MEEDRGQPREPKKQHPWLTRHSVELASLVPSAETTLCSNSLWSVPQRELTGYIMESHGADTIRFAQRREDGLRNHHAGQ